MASPHHFADLVRSYIRVRGLNQAEAARLCGFSESQMSSLLNRPRQSWPEAETVQKLGRLGIPAGEVMNAAAQDIGLGALYDEGLAVSTDPEVRAIAHVLEQVTPADRRRLTAIAAAYLDNSGDEK